MTLLFLFFLPVLAQIDSGGSGCVLLDLEVDGHTVGELLVVEDFATAPRGFRAGYEYWAWDAGEAWPEAFEVVDNGAGCTAPRSQVTDRSVHGAFDAVVQQATALPGAYEVYEGHDLVAWLDEDRMEWWGRQPGLIGARLGFERGERPAARLYPLD